jgi:beta-glucosidase
MCAYNSIDEWPACTNKMLLKDHLRDAWGFKGFVVSDCGAIVDVNQGHKKTEDITTPLRSPCRPAPTFPAASGPPASTRWPSGQEGLVTEDLITQAAERLYTARFKLGLFDPQGSNPLDRTPFTSSRFDPNQSDFAQSSRREHRAAEERRRFAAQRLPRRATSPSSAPPPTCCPPSSATTLARRSIPSRRSMACYSQFRSSPILYAQGSTLAEGVGVPVPRTAFGMGQGLKTEFFATPDWTGRPSHDRTEPPSRPTGKTRAPCRSSKRTNYSVRWTGALTVPAPGHYVFTLEPGDSFPYSPVESYRLTLDGKVLSEGSLRQGEDLASMGNFKAAPGASPTAPPVMNFPKPPSIPVDFTDTNPHDFKLEYSHSGDQSGGGLTLKWEAPAQAQLDEAVARAKESDVVVAFVGLSPQLEGEEMPSRSTASTAATAPASICPRRSRSCLKRSRQPASP